MLFRGRVNRWLVILAVVVAVFFGVILWDELSDDVNGSPEITFETDSLTISVEDGEEALLEGVSAEDPEDGDVTASIVIESISEFQDDGSRTVTYVAFDSADNVSKASRSLYYSDYESPQILLLRELSVTVGDYVNIQDCMEVQDVLDGNITSYLQVVDSDYSTYNTGDYTITLQVTNSAGDTEEVTYTIHSTDETEVSQTQITLTDYSIYLSQGDSFDPEDYIEDVTGFNYYGVESTLSEVEITDTVDTDTVGQYTVTYELSTYSGKDTAELVVIVR